MRDKVEEGGSGGKRERLGVYIVERGTPGNRDAVGRGELGMRTMEKKGRGARMENNERMARPDSRERRQEWRAEVNGYMYRRDGDVSDSSEA
jgi:hypothetical protein